MTVSRELGYAETYMHLLQAMLCGNGQIVCAVQLVGPLTPQLFIKAIRAIHERQPLLRAKVLKKDRYYFDLSVSFEDVPIRILPREDSCHWQRVMDSELTSIVPAKKYLWSIILLCGGERQDAQHEIVLKMNHAAADGVSIIHMFDDLLHILSTLREGASVDLPAYDLLPPVELLLPSPLTWDEFLANKTASQVEPDLMTAWKYHQNAPLGQRRTKAVYRKVDAETTRRLELQCRQRGTTVNALLSSVLLLSAQRQMGAGATISSPLFSMANLRNRTVPSVVADYLGCYFSVVATYHPQISGETDLYELAEGYRRMLNAAIPLQTNSPREFDLAELEKMVNDIVVSSSNSFNLGFSCSNMGAPAIETSRKDYRLKAFYAVTNQSAGNFPMMLNVITLSGEMFCTFIYTHPLMSDDWAAGYVERFLDILCSSIE